MNLPTFSCYLHDSSMLVVGSPQTLVALIRAETTIVPLFINILSQSYTVLAIDVWNEIRF